MPFLLHTELPGGALKAKDSEIFLEWEGNRVRELLSKTAMEWGHGDSKSTEIPEREVGGV